MAKTWTLKTYNDLVDQLNDEGENEAPENTDCFGWSELLSKSAPRRVIREDNLQLIAGSMTLNNNLDYSKALAASYAHSELYDLTNTASWTNCISNSFSSTLAQIPYYCVDCHSSGFDLGPSGTSLLTLAAFYAEEALTALQNWKLAINNEESSATIEAFRTASNSAAATHRGYSKAVRVVDDDRWTNIWNLVPSHSGIATYYRFYFYVYDQTIKRSGIFSDGQMTLENWLFEDSLCRQTGNSLTWEDFSNTNSSNYLFVTAPDGGYISLSQIPILRFNAEQEYIDELTCTGPTPDTCQCRPTPYPDYEERCTGYDFDNKATVLRLNVGQPVYGPPASLPCTEV